MFYKLNKNFLANDKLIKKKIIICFTDLAT